MFVSGTHLVHGRNEIQKETNDQIFYFFTFLAHDDAVAHVTIERLDYRWW